jgi:hypothetical protein
LRYFNVRENVWAAVSAGIVLVAAVAAVIVTVDVPVLAPELPVKVSMEVPPLAGIAPVEENVPVTPAGRPATLNMLAALRPPMGATVTVIVPLAE